MQIKVKPAPPDFTLLDITLRELGKAIKTTEEETRTIFNIKDI